MLDNSGHGGWGWFMLGACQAGVNAGKTRCSTQARRVSTPWDRTRRRCGAALLVHGRTSFDLVHSQQADDFVKAQPL
ncbi:MAG: hypothetical protein H0W38_15110 [Methylibium sp.]|nr:hypothetical protein [Methylibium sp.]